MSLTTLAEAEAVNTLVRHLSGKNLYPGEGPIPSREAAIRALVVLAESAYRKLAAGYHGDAARSALLTGWSEPASTGVVVDQVSADAAAAYLYLRPFLALSDLLPDGTPQDAPVRIGPLRTMLAERHALTTRAETTESAFDQLHARINRDFNFDAAESAAPEDEYWARLMDDLVTFANDLSHALETMTQVEARTGKPQPAPHMVTVTHLDPGFDPNDQKPHELLISNHASDSGWISHLVEHPAACNLLPYGQRCWFDDEWHNGQFTYDAVEPGLYRVLPAQQDVGDHRGEYSHTEDYLDYQRIGDAPKPPEPPAAVAAGYSEEPPF